MRHMRKIAVFLAVCMILCNMNVCVAHAATQKIKASTIKMEETEGTVTVINQKNKEVSVTEGMQLYSGDKIKTDAKSYAYISLDESKLIKLDELSEVLVEKNGKKLKLTLKEGALFFVVNEKLEEDESFTISTSTMALSIRGTSGVVRTRKVSGGYEDTIWLLEGRVNVSRLQGDKESFTLWGGEQVTFQGKDGKLDRRLIEMKELPGFAAMEIRKDQTLSNQIAEESGLDTEWICENAEKTLKSDQEENWNLWQQNQTPAATAAPNSGTTVDGVQPPVSTNPPVTEEEPGDNEDSGDVAPEEPSPPIEKPSEGTYTGKVLSYTETGESATIEFEANTGEKFTITGGNGHPMIGDLNENSFLNIFEVTVNIYYETLDDEELCKGDFTGAVQTEESRAMPIEMNYDIYVTDATLEMGDCTIMAYLHGENAQLILGDVSLPGGREEMMGPNCGIWCNNSSLQVGNISCSKGELNLNTNSTMTSGGIIDCDNNMGISLDETVAISGLETIVNTGSGFWIYYPWSTEKVTALQNTTILNSGSEMDIHSSRESSWSAGMVIKNLENQGVGTFGVGKSAILIIQDKLVITEAQNARKKLPVYADSDETLTTPLTGVFEGEVQVKRSTPHGSIYDVVEESHHVLTYNNTSDTPEEPPVTEDTPEEDTYVGKVLSYTETDGNATVEFEANTGDMFTIERGYSSMISGLNANNLLNDFEITVDISFETIDGVEYCVGNFTKASQTEESRANPLEINSIILVSEATLEMGDCVIKGELDGNKGAQVILDDLSLLEGGTLVFWDNASLQTGNIYSSNGWLDLVDGSTMTITGSITCDNQMFFGIDDTTIISGLQTIEHSGSDFEICGYDGVITALQNTAIVNRGVLKFGCSEEIVAKSLENQEGATFTLSEDTTVTFKEMLQISEEQSSYQSIYRYEDETFTTPMTGTIEGETQLSVSGENMILTEINSTASNTSMKNVLRYVAWDALFNHCLRLFAGLNVCYL